MDGSLMRHGKPGRERELVEVGARDQAGEFGEQRGVRENRRGEEVGGFLAGGRVAVVPEVRGEGVGEPAVDVGLDVTAGSPGEFVPDGFVAGAGLGLLQRAELAQRLDLIGTGRDPCGFAQFSPAGGGGRGVGGEFGPFDVVGVRVVDGARDGVGEQLREVLLLRELRRAADVVAQVLVPGRLPRVEPRFLEGRRDGVGVHPLRPAPYDPAADAGRVDRLAGHGDARGERSTGTAAGRPHPGHHLPRIRGDKSERAAARALYDDPPDFFIAGPEFELVRIGTRWPGRA
ncbi:hypothetical protein [Streptomyces sp. NPDC048489]|uniref:hypothetical protein n=1 Tax=Streptomyces sp. NPDC048489 TaxID=3154504 RepID=UPI00344AD6F8